MRVDEKYFRPTEVETLIGDVSQAKQKLGFPEITRDLCNDMIAEDYKESKRILLLKKEGLELPKTGRE